jgi:amino acid adenylation domain-containing protein
MLCHAVAVRLDALTADRVAAPVWGRVWTETVPARADEPAAVRLRDRELHRPVDPRTGPALRAVLLRYTDGQADLVLVADRNLLDPEELERLALGLCHDDVPATLGDSTWEPPRPPEWGLGDPAATGSVELIVHSGVKPDVLTAALGLVLARCEQRPTVRVGGADPVAQQEIHAEPGLPVADYLKAVVDTPSTDIGELPLVAIRRTETGPLVRVPVAVPLDVELAADTVRCRFSPRHLSRETVARLLRMTFTVARQLETAPAGTELRAIDLFDAEGRAELESLGGAGIVLPGPHRRIHDVVADRAAEAPDRVAVSGPDGELSYGRLLASADRVAGGLRARGVHPGDRVGVCLERSTELVVVLLGILRAGAAYVPLDPAYPAERLEYVVADAAPAVVVTATDVQDLLAGPSVEAAAGSPDDIAYVIYTSGSTGKPKGVAVPHRNVAALLDATAADFGLGRDDVWTFFHSVAFDFSVWEIWGCLMTGGRLAVVPYDVSRSPDEFRDLLVAERATVVSQTPSAFTQLRAVDRERPLHDGVRLIVLGGEPLNASLLRTWFDRHPEHACRVVNMFGITETTVHVTAQTVTRREALARSKSVGSALPGWSISIRDADGRLLPPGVAGEINVGGAGLAAGYLNLPDLTAQRFVVEDGERRYRSGDRGRLLPDGRVEHLGRLDSQVKLRGFRIELGEIRARLLDDPAVAAAAVVLRQPDPADAASARLDAYVVPAGADLDPVAVRDRAAAFLPAHMVPATVNAVAALPLTANGKVDTDRLPDPRDCLAPDAPVRHDGTVPDAVRAVWTRVFGVRVTPEDDFFRLGGNSLLAIRLMAALKAERLPPMSLRDLYLTPRCDDFARLVADAVG